MTNNRRSNGRTGPVRRDVLRAVPLLLARGQAVPAQTPESAASRPARADAALPDVVIENHDFRFVIGGNGIARSLIEKSTGQECLAPGIKTPVFSITQYAPLAGQLILLYPADAKTFAARTVRREGDRLLITFDGIPHQIAVGLKIAPGYVAFTVEQARTEGTGWEPSDRLKMPIEKLVLLQLPVRERANFGNWLNVMWDDAVAVNLLGANSRCRIGSEPRDGYRLLQASAEDRVGTLGVAAALVVTPAARLLDRIAAIENDFNLPKGVESRRSKEYKDSYYWAGGANPSTIDRHIRYARAGGFPMMMVSYLDFSKSAGHFPWRPEYPGHLEDLRGVVAKIKSAGMIPGLHIHYCKAEKSDPYVSGTPDHRLNMIRVFTLAAPLDATASDIPVEENPFGATLDDERRLLKIGSELITYEGYTTAPPYRFTGCRRAQLQTRAGAYEGGIMFGLLDVDTWPIFVRFNQNTTIQAEVAQRIARLYQAGFEFLYLDGAEDVHVPFWFTTARAQEIVYQALAPAPLLAEGAQRAHFNWHIMSRSNAYDIQQPENIRAAMHVYQEVQAPKTARDFTAINFGWMGYRAPDARSTGTQPDMVEYLVSRAAGWDCPFSIWPQLPALDSHPRTPDNLEVMRRWQQAVAAAWLTPSQKRELRISTQEHILIGDAGTFELLPYQRIPEVTARERPVCAFLFERGGSTWVVYWHLTGRAKLRLPLPPQGLRLWEEPGRKRLEFEPGVAAVVLPAEGRRYLECSRVSMHDVIRAFQSSSIV
jgi:hypothetical protein